MRGVRGGFEDTEVLGGLVEESASQTGAGEMEEEEMEGRLDQWFGGRNGRIRGSCWWSLLSWGSEMLHKLILEGRGEGFDMFHSEN